MPRSLGQTQFVVMWTHLVMQLRTQDFDPPLLHPHEVQKNETGEALPSAELYEVKTGTVVQGVCFRICYHSENTSPRVADTRFEFVCFYIPTLDLLFPCVGIIFFVWGDQMSCLEGSVTL